MEKSEIITHEPGYFVVAEITGGTMSVDRLDSLKQVAIWVIEEVDYYLSNSTMTELKAVTDSGGVASVELETSSGAVTLTVAHSRPAE